MRCPMEPQYDPREDLKVGDVCVMDGGSPQLRVDKIVGRDHEGYLCVRVSWQKDSKSRYRSTYRAVCLRLV